MTEAPANVETTLDTSDVDRYIGQPLPSVQLIDPVSVSDIRRWAQGMQYPNPLHYDVSRETVTITLPNNYYTMLSLAHHFP